MNDDIPAPGESFDEDPVTASHAAAEGAEAESDVGSSSALREMLLSTEPEHRLDAIESPWDPERGGLNRVYRGFQKMMGASGLPAVLDIGVGIAEFVTEFDLDAAATDSQQEGDNQPEFDTEEGVV
ncbi:hypothetical protein [Salinigranum rubrum]|nr:hypothetical protein [Salinigranum rubrum]